MTRKLTAEQLKKLLDITEALARLRGEAGMKTACLRTRKIIGNGGVSNERNTWQSAIAVKTVKATSKTRAAPIDSARVKSHSP